MPKANLLYAWRGRGGIALVLIVFFMCFCCGKAGLNAQTCGSDYVIKEGESLADIAARVYGDPSRWTLIFWANQEGTAAGGSPIRPGSSIRIPCLGAKQPGGTSREPGGGNTLFSVVRKIEFLTADGFPPFTDRSLPNGGVITHLVSASMDLMKEHVAGSFNYRMSWVNDRAAHVNSLLVTPAFDAGFPWLKPDCDHAADFSQDVVESCRNFLFSDPIYEIFTALFVRSNSPIMFASDDEIVGKTLCQPAGYSTYELDKGGRNWVKDNKVILLRPQTIEECFRLLDSGAVNAVVTADLTGKAVAATLRLSDRVKALPRPVAIGTLHVIVPKAHPHAATVIYYINAAVAKLKESGEYDRIVDSHLSRFWTTQDGK